MGYSWDIRGVFTEYSWGIRMYRVCVGYVSGMYREYVERNWVREMKLTTMVTTGAAINTLPRYEGDGETTMLRPNRTRSDHSTDREIRIPIGRYTRISWDICQRQGDILPPTDDTDEHG